MGVILEPHTYHGRISRYVLLTTVWLMLSTGFSFASEMIPCVDWYDGPSGHTAKFFRWPRFAPGAILFYVAQLILGYAYSTKVVIWWNPKLWRERRNFLAVLGYGCLGYFIGPIFVLNGPCDAEMSLGTRLKDAWVRHVALFAIFQYLGEFWTLLDYIDGLGSIALNAKFVRTWRRKQWTAVGIGLGIGACIGAYALYLLWTIRRVWWYGIAFVGIIALFFAVARMLSPTYSIHIHHYCIGLLAPFFPVHESAFSGIMQGLFIGISMEGFSRWGPDPIFIYESHAVVEEWKQPLDLTKQSPDSEPRVVSGGPHHTHPLFQGVVIDGMHPPGGSVGDSGSSTSGGDTPCPIV